MSIYTEDEAKTKWCPFARYATAAEPASNRWKQSAPESEPHALNPIPCRCIAWACMAFRPAGWRDKDDGSISRDPCLADPKYAEPVGYCGLAGKP